MEGNGKGFSMSGLKKALDESSSFHTSMNNSANMSLNQSGKFHSSKSISMTPNQKGIKKGNSNKLKSKTPVSDRFIPQRRNFEIAGYLMQKGANVDNENSTTECSNDSKKDSIYSKSVNESVLGVSDLSDVRVFSYAQKPKCPAEGYQNGLKVVYQGSSSIPPSQCVNYRVTVKTPDRVLDAPDIRNDFYLNLVEWGNSNLVAIALNDCVYSWSAHNASINTIPCHLHDSSQLSSVAWLEDGTHLLCAQDSGKIQIWDVEKAKLIRTIKTRDENCRIAAMSVKSHILTQGNRIGTLRNHDLRIAQHEVMTRAQAHSQEICGVRWSPDGRFCATGANDNLVQIWDSANMSNTCQPVCTFSEHLAAVKAMCWSPSHSSVLATGGGTNDRSIKIWNVTTGNLLRSTDTESQVSSLIWSEHYREILSTHGFTKNQLTLWKYPEMSKVSEVMGHTSRILFASLSPDQTTVATAGADETLRFWKIFPHSKSSQNKKKAKPASILSNGFSRIR